MSTKTEPFKKREAFDVHQDSALQKDGGTIQKEGGL